MYHLSIYRLKITMRAIRDARTQTSHGVMIAETEIPSCVRGYHIYEDRWPAGVGELLTCTREPTNAIDMVRTVRFRVFTRSKYLNGKYFTLA